MNAGWLANKAIPWSDAMKMAKTRGNTEQAPIRIVNPVAEERHEQNT
jgi:hypothetical protein